MLPLVVLLVPFGWILGRTLLLFHAQVLGICCLVMSSTGLIKDEALQLPLRLVHFFQLGSRDSHTNPTTTKTLASSHNTRHSHTFARSIHPQRILYMRSIYSYVQAVGSTRETKTRTHTSARHPLTRTLAHRSRCGNRYIERATIKLGMFSIIYFCNSVA